MRPIEYAACLLYCDQAYHQARRAQDHDLALRWAEHTARLEREIARKSKPFGDSVDRHLIQLVDAPDLVQDLARNVVEHTL